MGGGQLAEDCEQVLDNAAAGEQEVGGGGTEDEGQFTNRSAPAGQPWVARFITTGAAKESGGPSRRCRPALNRAKTHELRPTPPRILSAERARRVKRKMSCLLVGNLCLCYSDFPHTPQEE